MFHTYLQAKSLSLPLSVFVCEDRVNFTARSQGTHADK